MIHILSLHSLSLQGAPAPLFWLLLAEAEEISRKWRVTNPRCMFNVDCESRNLLQMASLVCGLEGYIQSITDRVCQSRYDINLLNTACVPTRWSIYYKALPSVVVHFQVHTIESNFGLVRCIVPVIHHDFDLFWLTAEFRSAPCSSLLVASDLSAIFVFRPWNQ